MSLFTLQASDGAARAGVLHTAHGPAPTPAFMPVGTQGSVKAVGPQDLREIGARIILSNTYHLYLRPGVELVRTLGGLHGFMAWQGPILTDSGGFQVFSLGHLRALSEEGVRFRSHIDGSEHLLTPELAVAYQEALGSDIAMALDHCPAYGEPREAVAEAMERTHRWAERCLKAWTSPNPLSPSFDRLRTGSSRHGKGAPKAEQVSGEAVPSPLIPLPQGEGRQAETSPSVPLLKGEGRHAQPSSSIPLPVGGGGKARPALFAIVQGGWFAELRRQSARALASMDFPGYAIGGVSVGEPKALAYEAIEEAAPLLPRDRPRYVMGVGSPEDLVEGIARGIDLFDCALPTRVARNGALFTPEGRVNLRSTRYRALDAPVDPSCDCPACRTHSAAYLHHLFRAGELLYFRLASIHNLRFILRLMEQARAAIVAGRYEAFARAFRERYQTTDEETRLAQKEKWLAARAARGLDGEGQRET